MSGKQLVPIKSQLPMVYKKPDESNIIAVVNYERIDPFHYSFFSHLDDGVDLRMDESGQAAGKTDYVDVEFDSEIKESDKIYYSLAAASGLLTGALCTIHFSEEQLNGIDSFKEKNWRPVIIKVANLVGYKKSDYKGATTYIVNRAVRTVEKINKTKEIITALSEHPSIAGLVFSIVAQYSGKEISITDNGKIIKKKLPEYYTIGETNAEKIVCAFLYWLFSLGINEALSKRRVLDEMGISKDLLQKIKEFINLPLFNNLPSDYSEAEESFSEWLRNTIKGAELYLKDENTEKNRNPLLGLTGIALNLAEDSFPVLINECIVRAVYILIRLCIEIRENKISSFEQLSMIPAASLLPLGGRTLSRMCLIASASFVGMNIAGATLTAIKEKKVNGRKFSETFFTELNIVGIGRFLYACYADSKYWGDEICILLQRNSRKNDTSEDCYFDGDDTAFEPLFLDAIQARILYCLENFFVQYDIAHTENKENAVKKELWLKTWKEMLLAGIGVSPELTNDYFIVDEDLLYNGIYQLSQDKSNWRWFYLLTQELALFKPYITLGSPDDKAYKKLKIESDYVRDQFVRRQTIVSQDEVDRIVKTYSKYSGYVSGKTRNMIVGVGATAVAAIATGGFALTFAPGIAAVLAGEAVIGLHGAALTSASLAFVGGGSLAAGGLGVAGGTAIITGGGALIGLAGSGSISAATFLLQTPSEYWVRQSAKLLTYSNCILGENLNDLHSIFEIIKQLDIAIDRTEKELASIDSEKNDLNKELIKNAEEYLKYLKKCRSELMQITKRLSN